MRPPGMYYLNNSGHRWVVYPKPKVLVYHAAKGYCKMRTIEYFEAFGNFAVACLRYEGKMYRRFLDDCNGVNTIFIDHEEKMR